MPTAHEDASSITRWAHLNTAVIGDALDAAGRYHQFLPAAVRPLALHMRLVGRAMPVLISDVFGTQRKPFGLLTEALDELQEGEVYIARSGRVQCAAWGEILTAAAKSRGAAGAVIDGYHRDTHRVLGQDWPVFSRGSYGQDAAVRAAVTDYRTPIEISGVEVAPGDLVVGDADGVVVVPQDVEQEIFERARQKLATEAEVRVLVREGTSTTTVFDRFGVL